MKLFNAARNFSHKSSRCRGEQHLQFFSFIQAQAHKSRAEAFRVRELREFLKTFINLRLSSYRRRWHLDVQVGQLTNFINFTELNDLRFKALNHQSSLLSRNRDSNSQIAFVQKAVKKRSTAVVAEICYAFAFVYNSISVKIQRRRIIKTFCRADEHAVECARTRRVKISRKTQRKIPKDGIN